MMDNTCAASQRSPKEGSTHTANKNVNPVTNVVQHGDGEWREAVRLREKETDPKTKANETKKKLFENRRLRLA